MPVSRLRPALLVAVFSALAAPAALADTDPAFAPVELDPIEPGDGHLTVISPDGSETVYTARDLEALPTYAVETTTPWELVPRRFEGVLLADLVERHGLVNVDLEVLAENDYATDVAAEVAADGHIMIATRIDGRPLSLRDRGPLLFVVPPAAVSDETGIGERHMVWMAVRIRPNS